MVTLNTPIRRVCFDRSDNFDRAKTSFDGDYISAMIARAQCQDHLVEFCLLSVLPIELVLAETATVQSEPSLVTMSCQTADCARTRTPSSFSDLPLRNNKAGARTGSSGDGSSHLLVLQQL